MPQRNPYLDEHLVVGQRCLVRPGQKIVDGDFALSGGSPGEAHRVQHRAHGREILGRVGLTKRSPDGAAVAHDGVGDDAFGVADDGADGRQVVRLQCFAVTRHRTDTRERRIDDDVAELGNQVVDVDQVLGVGDAKFHHGQQAVAAGDEHRSVTEPVKQPDGVIDACGAFVLERSRNLHVTDLTLVC